MSRTILKWQEVVVWKPNQTFEKSEKKGRDPEREIAPSLFCDFIDGVAWS